MSVSSTLPCRKVLLAEDEAPIRFALSALLENEGFCVTAVPDGTSALARIEGEPFDFAILDISMPGLTGWQVAEQVRAGATSRPPVLVALTSLDRRQDVERSRQAGFDVHLAKPLRFNRLRQVLTGLDCAG